MNEEIEACVRRESCRRGNEFDTCIPELDECATVGYCGFLENAGGVTYAYRIWSDIRKHGPGRVPKII